MRRIMLLVGLAELVFMMLGCGKAEAPAAATQGGENKPAAPTISKALEWTALATPPAALLGEWDVDRKALMQGDGQMDAETLKQKNAYWGKGHLRIAGNMIAITGVNPEWQMAVTQWQASAGGLCAARGQATAELGTPEKASIPASYFFLVQGDAVRFGMANGEEDPPADMGKALRLVKAGAGK